MKARDRVLDGFEVFGMTRKNAEIMYKHLVASVKAEAFPPSVTEPFFNPELIQGYTAEQWKEIIGGGYLCEFTDTGDNREYVYIGTLRTNRNGEKTTFVSSDGRNWNNCRPAQIKGVMMPIFVEPSAPETWCSFFGDHSHVGDERWCVRKHTGHFPTATKYIEL